MISDYTSLQAEVSNHLNRQDLASAVPTFIQMAEARFQRQMRCREMVMRQYAQTLVGLSTGANAEYLPLPADFLQLKSATIINGSQPYEPLAYASMDEIDRLNALNVTGGRPTDYNIVGSALRLGPFPDAQYTIEIVYYAKLPKLSAQQTRNWLLADHPDYYLYASLLAAAPFLKDDDRVPMWGGLVGSAEGPNGGTGIMGEIKLMSERSEVSGSTLKARVRNAYGSNGTYSNY